MNQHVPVLLKESVDLLVTDREGIYFDGTVGFGGHSSEILNRLKKSGKLIATDKDVEAFEFCKKKFERDKRFTVFNTSFTDIDLLAKIEFIENFDGIFVDLGVSSYQLDNIQSGFTFREDAPLDLRMNKKSGVPAADILNKLPLEELTRIFREYGEEKNAFQIAKKIVELRESEKFNTSFHLKAVIDKLTPPPYRIKSLTRIFQALRIYVNKELEELKKFLDKAIDLLKPGGRIVVLTYHSLEDRIVKEKFKYETLECICPKGTPVCICGKVKRLRLLSSKPILPRAEEIALNRRARSAKLRAAEKI